MSVVRTGNIKSPLPEAISTGVQCQVKDGKKVYVGEITVPGQALWLISVAY